ncbi:protein kinase [bacterium]|nr:protein kinase [bacterium]
MIGKTISHYKILEKLGEGGMGVVYKAEDTKLKRIVALKFLMPTLTADPAAKERFIQEAQAASALEHPNICNIHEISETEDDRLYIVMACYEGQTLKERLATGLLPIEQAISYACQIAEGLAEAHDKGIVHRDIKPSNIMITEKGQVKIMDFGLAKLAGQTRLTKTGTTLGTAAYMSPEQARGEKVDYRADLWSLGVVLYEMLAGQPPFTAEYDQAVVYSILNEEPKALDSFRKGIPKSLTHLVEKCLEKNPALRYQNMKEMIEELDNVKAGSPRTKNEKSILVLPFEDMSPGKDNEYFSDGLTEELITDLSRVHDLLVISRSSAMTFKGTKKTLGQIAAEVGVQYVLEGSVRKAGNNLRITAQLIDAADDFHVWAEKFSGTLDDVFDIQEKVSRSIVDALKLKLTPKEAGFLAERPIPNALAYEFYLKARGEILKWTEAGLDNASKYLHSGLEIAGENALLYAGIAYVHFQYFNLGLKEQKYCRERAEENVIRAFALEPDCPQASFVRAVLVAWNNPVEGIKCFKRVLAKNPNEFDTLFVFSCLLGTLGRKSDIVPLEQRTIRIDPLNAAAHFHSGFNRLWDGEYPQALEVLSRLHEKFPEDILTTFAFGLSLAHMGRQQEAGHIFDQVAKEQPGTLFACLSQSFKWALAGDRSGTLKALESNPSVKDPWDFQTTYWKTECLALIGEKERALGCLELDVNLGMSNYPLMSELDPFLDNIRGEERFHKLMVRVKDEWEHLEV